MKQIFETSYLKLPMWRIIKTFENILIIFPIRLFFLPSKILMNSLREKCPIMEFFKLFFKECPLQNAINFTEQHTKVSEKDKVIIFHARKSLLFSSQHFWIKKEGRLFDVTMGAFDEAEVCEAVGNFLLYQLSKNYGKKDIDLCKDEGLAIFKNISGSKAAKIIKDIQKLFKDNHLDITIQCNLKIVNYLEVTFNLSNDMYQRFCKTNNKIIYIHKE